MPALRRLAQRLGRLHSTRISDVRSLPAAGDILSRARIGSAGTGAVPPVRRRRGRPRRRPEKLHGDKGYDHRFCRRDCRMRGITPRITRRGIESSARLGRHRWGVERTLAWLNRFRRLTVRYERRADIHLAFTTLACAIICVRQIRRLC